MTLPHIARHNLNVHGQLINSDLVGRASTYRMRTQKLRSLCFPSYLFDGNCCWLLLLLLLLLVVVVVIVVVVVVVEGTLLG